MSTSTSRRFVLLLAVICLTKGILVVSLSSSSSLIKVYSILVCFFSQVTLFNLSFQNGQRGANLRGNVNATKLQGPDEIAHGRLTSERGFKITLKHMGRDTTYNAIFERAARKWEKIIVGDLPDVPRRSSTSHSWFGNTFKEKINVDIDDVLIGYEMEEIDGKGGVLGHAGPVYTRTDDPSKVTAISGIMKFDKVDFSE